MVSQGIFGIQPDFAGLKVDPCVPKSWKNFDVTRKFRGDTYQIKVTNPKGVSKGVASLTVDGKTVAGNVIPVAGDGKTHQVEVVLG